MRIFLKRLIFQTRDKNILQHCINNNIEIVKGAGVLSIVYLHDKCGFYSTREIAIKFNKTKNA
ncbi:hypothetical protein SAE01_23540 [Segetibacter aerophilus]|uniref:Uncharacterized protein n=1 Tax=Segetibacter aerophilus TaxID=670293 RepID=A0A512BD25_9BACT|nr:hypothetical protein SAE01_23540 [Segetibacter aerophilus]